MYELEDGRWRKTMVWPSDGEAYAHVYHTIKHAEIRALKFGENEAEPEPETKPKRKRRSPVKRNR